MQKIKEFDEKTLISFLKSLGIVVKTNTKARSHQGCYFNNRIDISVKTPKEKRVQTLIHEFAHKIHSDIEPDIHRKNSQGGSLEKLFDCCEVAEIYEELVDVTNFVDKNSLFEELIEKKEKIKKQIKQLEIAIKEENPEFQRSKDFVYAKNFFKKNKTDAAYLLKHDRIILVSPILRRKSYYDIKNIDEDFPDLPVVIRDYIKIKSLQRKQKAISVKINKFTKYYHRPTELFARFVEGLYLDCEKISCIAPHSCDKFFELLNNGYYGSLKELFTEKENAF